MKARDLKPGDVIDPGAGMQPFAVARIERTKGSSKHGFLYVVRVDGTMNTYMNDTEVEVVRS